MLSLYVIEDIEEHITESSTSLNIKLMKVKSKHMKHPKLHQIQSTKGCLGPHHYSYHIRYDEIKIK